MLSLLPKKIIKLYRKGGNAAVSLETPSSFLIILTYAYRLLKTARAIVKELLYSGEEESEVEVEGEGEDAGD